MKFPLDVCVSSQSLTRFLIAEGHDFLSALAVDPKASDERRMDLALQGGRVLVTEDKDFGELVFIHRLAHGPIVRMVDLMVDEQVLGPSDRGQPLSETGFEAADTAASRQPSATPRQRLAASWAGLSNKGWPRAGADRPLVTAIASQSQQIESEINSFTGCQRAGTTSRRG